MKVILVNGSPHEKGSTYTALREVEKPLIETGIGTEIVWLGDEPISGCTACYTCHKLGKCRIDDGVNRFVEKAASVDGFIFGSPVHYAGASGSIISFLDRAFFSNGEVFRYKPGAAIVCLRRGGATTAFDQLNKFFTISNMPVVSSCYWNMVYGMSPEQVSQDKEGMLVMRTLGRNMAWMLQCIAAGKTAGIMHPEPEKPS